MPKTILIVANIEDDELTTFTDSTNEHLRTLKIAGIVKNWAYMFDDEDAACVCPDGPRTEGHTLLCALNTSED